MKWMQVQKILMTHGVKILAAMLGAGVIGTAAVQSRMDDNAFSPSGHSRAILQNEVVYPGEEERTRANGEGDGKDAWEKAEELLEEKLAQSDEADSALFDESRIAGRIEDANVLVGDFEDDLSDRKDRGTDRASKQNAHGQLDGRSVYVRDNNAQDGSPVIPALNRDRIVGRTGDNAADDGRTGKNGVTTGRNDSRRSTGTSETSNGGTEYSGYDRRQRSDNAEAASADDRTRAITPAIDPSKPVVKTPEEERIERLREEYKQYDFVIPESHPANIGYTTSISEKRLARMEAKEDARGKKEAVVTINKFKENQRKFTTSDVLDAATILYAYDVKLDYGNVTNWFGKTLVSNKISSYQIDNPAMENVQVIIEDGDDDHQKKVRVIVGYGPKVRGGNSPYDYAYLAESDVFKIKLYDERVIFVDENGKEIGSKYYNDGDVCKVFSTDMPMFAEGSTVETYYMEDDKQYISKLFQGVSETPDGEVIDHFEIGPEGRIDGKRVLYAKKSFDVPSSWRIQKSSYYDDDGEDENQESWLDEIKLAKLGYEDDADEDDYVGRTIGFAVLKSIDDTSKDVTVPYGVEEIDGDINVRSLTISNQVRKINLSKSVITKGFFVSDDNPYFAVSKNGLLTDKEGETLYGVPAKTETIVIPPEIKEIACNFAEGQTVQFTGDEQPRWQDNQADMMENQSLKIVLPKDSYLEYLRKWRMDTNAMSNIYVDGDNKSLAEQQIFVEQDGAVVQRINGSDDRLILLRIPDGIYARGAYVVPNTVEEIAAGAIPAGEPLGLLVIPESVKKIDVSILYEQNVEDYIYLMHKDSAPEIVINGGSTGLTEEGKKLTEIKVLNEEVQQKLADYNKDKNVTENKGEIIVYNGNVYDVQEPYEDGQLPALLLRRANPAATTFCEKEDVPAGYELVMVNSNAFANCKNLRTVELPETATMILEHAFDGCSNLEGVLSKATGELYVMPDVFSGCDNLRFFAVNTDNSSVYFADEQDKHKLWTEKDGFESINILYTSDYFSTPVQYSLEKANGGEVLFATEDLSQLPNNSYSLDDDAQTPLILVSATTGINGTVELHGAQIIANQAFASCTLPFTFDVDEWDNVYQFMNQAFKNATGFRGVTVEGVEQDGFVPIGEGVEFENSEGKSIGTYLALGTQVFENCTGIRHVTIKMGDFGEYYITMSEDEDKEYDVITILPRIENGVFQGCSNLETVAFVLGDDGESHIEQISFGAFDGTKVTEIYLPDSITQIDNMAFGEALKHLDFIGKVFASDDDYDQYGDDQNDDADENEGTGEDENETQEVADPVRYVVPELMGQSYDNMGDRQPFRFKQGNQETANDFTITFNGGKSGDECPEIASQFLQQWRYNMLGYSSADEMFDHLFYSIYTKKNGERFESLRKQYGDRVKNASSVSGSEADDLSEEERSEKLKDESIGLIREFIVDSVSKTENQLKKMMSLSDEILKKCQEYISVATEVDTAIQYANTDETASYAPVIPSHGFDEMMLEESLAIDLSDTTDVTDMLEELTDSITPDEPQQDTVESQTKEAVEDSNVETSDDKQEDVTAKEVKASDEENAETASSEKVEAKKPVTSDQPETDENIAEYEKSETIESAPAEDDEVPIEEDADAAEEVEEITTDTVEDAELAEEITADDTELDAVADDSSDENLIETADEVASEAIEEPEADISTQDAEAVTNESETVVEPVNDSSEPDSAEVIDTVEETVTTEE